MDFRPGPSGARIAPSPVVPPMSVLESLLLGVLLGVAYSAAALLVARKAAGMDPTRALRLVMAGMLVRMVFALGAVALVLVVAPVQRAPFVLGLGVTFVLGLLAEVSLLGRRSTLPDSQA